MVPPPFASLLSPPYLNIGTNKHRLFPFMIVSGALGIFFIALILILAMQRFLLPGIIIVGSFVLFVLWLTGLVETALQLYGVVGSVNDSCKYWVEGNGIHGDSIEALAWLTQITICMSSPSSTMAL